MYTKTITAALVAAAFSGFVANSSASAQTYGSSAVPSQAYDGGYTSSHTVYRHAYRSHRRAYLSRRHHDARRAVATRETNNVSK